MNEHPLRGAVDKIGRELYALEQNLLRHIQLEVGDFRTCTGLSPSAVSVRVVDITQLGDPHPQFEVESVSVILERIQSVPH